MKSHKFFFTVVALVIVFLVFFFAVIKPQFFGTVLQHRIVVGTEEVAVKQHHQRGVHLVHVDHRVSSVQVHDRTAGVANVESLNVAGTVPTVNDEVNVL